MTSTEIPSSASSAAAAPAQRCTMRDQLTMVTSPPSRSVRAAPRGIVRSSSSGTLPAMPQRFLCSM